MDQTHREGAIICTATELKKAGIPGRTGQYLGAMDIDFNRLLADAVRELAEEPSIVTTLERVVDLCTETMQACTAACVTVVQEGEIRTLAATDAALVVVDQLQTTLGRGPVHSAPDRQEPVVVADLGADARWPDWGRRVVADAGLRSLLGLRLFTSDGSAGMLNLYSSAAGAFDQEDVLEGQVLAAHASVALATTLKERQLHQALQHRTVIGQATGILIERFGLTPDQAFAVMRRVSQHHNIKVHTLAEHLVRTGELLDVEPMRTVDDVGDDLAATQD